MKLAAIQMVSATGVESNLAAAHALLREAAAQGAELAVLPEYFCIMGLKDTDKLAAREAFGDGPIQDFLSRSAKELGLWIVGGTLPLACSDPGRVRNSSLAFAPSGVCVARYDKMHLFRFTDGREAYDETRVLQPGTGPVGFELASTDGHVYKVGMSVCYDLRFPELYRALNADLLLVPSAFTTTTGQAHWEILLRARPSRGWGNFFSFLRVYRRSGSGQRQYPNGDRSCHAGGEGGARLDSPDVFFNGCRGGRSCGLCRLRHGLKFITSICSF